MNPIFAELLTVAKKVDNYAIDATGGGLWTDTTHYRVTCPADKRWFVLGGVVNRAVSATCIILISNAGDDVLDHVDQFAAAAVRVGWPSNLSATTTPQSRALPRILDAGDYLEMTFSVAQDSSSFASCQVLEVDV